jgi:hypothetical protein
VRSGQWHRGHKEGAGLLRFRQRGALFEYEGQWAAGR